MFFSYAAPFKRTASTIGCVPIKKYEENEIAESLRIQGGFPRVSFDKGKESPLPSSLQRRTDTVAFRISEFKFSYPGTPLV